MKFIPDNLYHIYNQGNNKQIIFSSNEDYLIYIRMIRKYILPHSEIIAYCLMPNHFHFLVYTDERVNAVINQGGLLLDPLTNGFRKLLSGYARIYNKLYNKTGSLFRQKTKFNSLSDTYNSCSDKKNHDYYFNCFHYIHQNPLRAGLVHRLEDWDYSSYKDYARFRTGTLCNKELASKFCSYDPESFIQTSYGTIPGNTIDQLL